MKNLLLTNTLFFKKRVMLMNNLKYCCLSLFVMLFASCSNMFVNHTLDEFVGDWYGLKWTSDSSSTNQYLSISIYPKGISSIELELGVVQDEMKERIKDSTLTTGYCVSIIDNGKNSEGWYQDSNSIKMEGKLEDNILHFTIHGSNDSIAEAEIEITYENDSTLHWEVTNTNGRTINIPSEMELQRDYYLNPEKQVAAKDVPSDQLDFFVAEGAVEDELLKGKTYYNLNSKERKTAVKILKDYMKSGKYVEEEIKNYYPYTTGLSEEELKMRKQLIDQITPFPFDHYFHQYLPYTENGEIKVRVYLAYHWEGPYQIQKWYIQSVCDGGKYYGDAVINLTKGKIEYFSLHGEA